MVNSQPDLAQQEGIDWERSSISPNAGGYNSILTKQSQRSVRHAGFVFLWRQRSSVGIVPWHPIHFQPNIYRSAYAE
jgi:hypothetical protein